MEEIKILKLNWRLMKSEMDHMTNIYTPSRLDKIETETCKVR